MSILYTFMTPLFVSLILISRLIIRRSCVSLDYVTGLILCHLEYSVYSIFTLQQFTTPCAHCYISCLPMYHGFSLAALAYYPRNMHIKPWTVYWSNYPRHVWAAGITGFVLTAIAFAVVEGQLHTLPRWAATGLDSPQHETLTAADIQAP